MQIIHTIAALRSALPRPQSCAFVPTMGNLHEGHLTLVRQAAATGLPVAVSIFVNRLQFAPHEDFDQYPRTLARDAELLHGAGASLLFAPDETELYPEPQTFRIEPDPALAGILEGEFRPGFFTGVSTVVMKLFQCVQPQLALFGKKDYQQWLVIRQMARQFALPVAIEGGETCRADDGLALSSRNGYLNETERREAVALPQALRQLAEKVHANPEARLVLEARAMQGLRDRGWVPDYLTVRRRSDLLPPDDGSFQPLVALGAARLGTTRLIDNLEF